MCFYKAKQILPLNVQFHSNPPHAKKLYLHIFDIVDTTFIMKENWSSAHFRRIFPREKEEEEFSNMCWKLMGTKEFWSLYVFGDLQNEGYV